MLNLTAVDRCDRCGAQAYYRAEHRRGDSDLLFCVHHYREHRDKLVQEDWVICSDNPDDFAEPVVSATTE